MRIAIPKGKYLEHVCEALQEAGLDVQFPHKRQYRVNVKGDVLTTAVQAKMRDIPILLQNHGFVAGIVGDEWVRECQLENSLLRLADTSIYHARIVLVARNGFFPPWQKDSRDVKRLTVFTKYPHLATQCMKSHKVPHKIVQIAGVAEAMLGDMNSLGVVCAETGQTLAMNGLWEIETVMQCALCLYTVSTISRESTEWNFLELISERLSSRQMH
jgi:ATP phosphoribosyltransferase